MLWAAVPRIELPALALLASSLILWAVICLLICILLFLSLRVWPVAALLAVLWIAWFGACATRDLRLDVFLALLLGTVVPAGVLVAVGLLVVAGYLLPPSPESRRWKALRALLTFTMGTTPPYFAVVSQGDEDNELVWRAPGARCSSGCRACPARTSPLGPAWC